MAKQMLTFFLNLHSSFNKTYPYLNSHASQYISWLCVFYLRPFQKTFHFLVMWPGTHTKKKRTCKCSSFALMGGPETDFFFEENSLRANSELCFEVVNESGILRAAHPFPVSLPCSPCLLHWQSRFCPLGNTTKRSLLLCSV